MIWCGQLKNENGNDFNLPGHEVLELTGRTGLVPAKHDKAMVMMMMQQRLLV